MFERKIKLSKEDHRNSNDPDEEDYSDTDILVPKPNTSFNNRNAFKKIPRNLVFLQHEPKKLNEDIFQSLKIKTITSLADDCSQLIKKSLKDSTVLKEKRKAERRKCLCTDIIKIGRAAKRLAQKNNNNKKNFSEKK